MFLCGVGLGVFFTPCMAVVTLYMHLYVLSFVEVVKEQHQEKPKSKQKEEVILQIDTKHSTEEKKRKINNTGEIESIYCILLCFHKESPSLMIL